MASSQRELRQLKRIIGWDLIRLHFWKLLIVVPVFLVFSAAGTAVFTFPYNSARAQVPAARLRTAFPVDSLTLSQISPLF